MASFTITRRARKVHYCTECGGRILAGEHYRRHTATPHDEVWNCDDWSVLKVCAECSGKHGNWTPELDHSEPAALTTDAPAAGTLAEAWAATPAVLRMIKSWGEGSPATVGADAEAVR